jgi:predicted dehydrogenase
MSKTVKDVEVTAEPARENVAAPELPYQPHDPKAYQPNIGIIGCGGISGSHLRAYKLAGYKVVALCDLIEARANSRRDEYFPDASVTTDYRDILSRDDIQVVDLITHPIDRQPLIEAALNARKHVLSQKPFVLDLAVGQRFVDLAKANGVLLAVNQNGRWAPYLGYMREAVRRGLVGDVLGIHLQQHFDHTWTKGTPFEQIEDMILYDYAIHFFDFVASVIPNRKIKRVYATKSFAAGQDIKVPMLAQALVDFEGGQASLVFDAHTKFGLLDTTYIAGSTGSLFSTGTGLEHQSVQYINANGVATPDLQGSWFVQGFHGTMGELLSAIEEKRSPLNNAQDNLRSLALAFAAIASANTGRPYEIGEITKLWTPKDVAK